MTEPSPASDVWLGSLLDRSPLLPDASLRKAWRLVLPRLPIAARYELAAVLLEVEQSLECD